jgi:hypothetical protein
MASKEFAMSIRKGLRTFAVRATVVCAAVILPAAANAQELRLQEVRLPELSSVSQKPPRPASLLPLYVSFGALQVLDVHSTLNVLDNGGREGNAIMSGVVRSPAAFVAVKAGAGAGVILLTEKLWKRNRTAAILTMIGLNGAYVTIVSHNYSLRR